MASMMVAPLPSISVIVPNWNDSRYLPRCLRSVLEQETPPEELIIVDDASTDESVATINSVIQGNARAQLIVNAANQGTNRTINSALGRARSEYVLLLSANDFVLPGIFSRAKACLARSPGAGLWSAMAWLVDENDRPIRLHPSPIVALKDAYLSSQRCSTLALRAGNWFNGPTLIWHRTALRAVGGLDPAYGAAADLFTGLTLAGQRGAAYSPEPLAAARIHGGRYSSRDLTDLAVLDARLERLRGHSHGLSPQMFSAGFVERTASRFRFGAIRISGGKLFPEVAGREGGLKGAALRIADRLVPAGLRSIRVVFAFLVLRPFDIAPTLVYRLFPWIVVRIRLMVRGGARKTEVSASMPRKS
jgi:glycosyltransferase involved in cell wall biosynthesis